MHQIANLRSFQNSFRGSSSVFNSNVGSSSSSNITSGGLGTASRYSEIIPRKHTTHTHSISSSIMSPSGTSGISMEDTNEAEVAMNQFTKHMELLVRTGEYK